MRINPKVTGDSLTAPEFNQIPYDIQNAISSAGLTPSSSTLTQLSQAISQMVSDANFFSTSGTETNIILSANAPRVAPTKLTDGMMLRFRALYTNGANPTINLNNLGAKNITKEGENLNAGDLEENKLYMVCYSSANDNFELMTTAEAGGMEIGDIGIAFMGINEGENKRRYLNGQVISQEQFPTFTLWLKSKLELYPQAQCTEEEWQEEISVSVAGQCGKVVINDENGTIRLPKVVNIQGCQDLANNLGVRLSESLPNITGSFATDQAGESKGCFYLIGTPVAYAGGDGYGEMAGFDASRSSSTYQDNAPVQQEAIQYPFYIQVVKGGKTELDVTNEYTLNNPFSLFDSKYDTKDLQNSSWLASKGQWNDGTLYQGAYEKLLKEYNGTENEMPKVLNGYFVGYNVKGEFSNGEYTTNGGGGFVIKDAPESVLGNTIASFEICTRIKFDGNLSSYGSIFSSAGSYYNNPHIICPNGLLTLYLSSNGSTWDICSQVTGATLTVGETYDFKFIWTGTQYYLDYKLASASSYTRTITVSSSARCKLSERLCFLNCGNNYTVYSTKGTLYLDKTYIKVNNKMFSQAYRKNIAITETVHLDDFQIDTENTMFKLPLIDGNEQEIDYSSKTETDAKVWHQVSRKTFVSFFGGDSYMEDYWAFVSPDGGMTTYPVGRRTDDYNQYTETTSFNATVPKDWWVCVTAEAGVRYYFYNYVGNGTLYYYVGDTNVTPSTTNFGQFTNALSKKVDLPTATKSSFPSNRYIDISLGTSGTLYTAPADGWVNIVKTSTAPQYMILKNITKGISVRTNNTNGVDQSGLLIPISKNDIYTVQYTYAGETQIFRFIYAEGSKGE